MKRVGIYVFFDEDGYVDDFVIFYLRSLLKNLDRLIVIVNGTITAEGRKRIESEKIEVFVRENKGIDFWAYKAGIELIGWSELKKYDELVLTNCSCYGPLYPFEEIFSKMDSEKADFWGMVKHPRLNMRIFKAQKKDYLYEHIMSYFMVIRKKMLNSPEFKTYWDNLCEINSYEEAVSWHENMFTSYFENAGFTCSTFVDLKKYEKRIYNSSIQMAYDLAKEDRCPLVKKKAIFAEYSNFLTFCNGHQPRQLMDFIDKETDYDVNYIWKNLLRTQKGSVLKNNLHLNYILPIKCKNTEKSIKYSVALILYIYYEDMIEYCFEYAKSMPQYSHIYIITINKKIEEVAKNIFCNLMVSKVEYLQQENRGRDVSAVLVTAKGIIPQYDYVCFAHDKKTPTLEVGLMGEDYCRHCFEGVLKNKNYVANILEMFDQNPYLGFLTPPPPIFGDFYQITGREWGTDFEIAQDVLKNKLNLKIKMDNQPVAAYGTVFWFRSKAFKTLLTYDWKYSDFPKEPIGRPDGTILHALERLYPLLAQHDGYLSGWIMPSDFASVYMGNLYYMLRNLNLRLFSRYGYERFQNIVNMLDNEWKVSKKFKFIDVLGKEIKYLKYKIMSKITWGKTRKKYKLKRKALKNKFKQLKLNW